jgi:hypothetical protein
LVNRPSCPHGSAGSSGRPSYGIAAIIEHAEAVLERDDVQADFTEFVDETFEDADGEQLFDPALDGIEESESGRKLGMAHLFEDWRRPFRAGNPVHAYVHFD